MRVVAGSARSIPLVTPQGKDTRPTTDRIKETLFNVIQNDVPGSRFLDLFAGSGAIGIEAISRGAKEAVLIEMAKEPLTCIHTNVAKTKMAEQITILPMEVSYGIQKLSREHRKFDVVFADPPYRDGYEAKILQSIQMGDVLEHGGLVILETLKNTPVDYVDESYFEIVKIKTYKTNQHVMLRKKDVEG